MPTPTLTHKVTVTPHHGPTTGRTYQAHCTCNYRSPHVPTTHRANQIAEEHAARTGGDWRANVIPLVWLGAAAWIIADALAKLVVIA